jgi:UDP-glucose 4-epimerase
MKPFCDIISKKKGNKNGCLMGVATHMNILVTGGAGYIGSHTCVSLMEAGASVIVADNLCNSSVITLKRVEQLAGKNIIFYEIDVTDEAAVEQIFRTHHIDSIIHFAGLKAVGESVVMPLQYYYNNIVSTMVLAKVAQKYGVNRFIFSSSATVYGENKSPLVESMPLMPRTNPYGETKAMSERILMDMAKAIPEWSVVLLRYFNPVGAHESGLIGEAPNGIPNNLMPYITQVAVGKREKLSVFGDDYQTHDGTGVRDYIHVVDLALGHVKALNKVQASTGVHVYNLGTGVGYSVLDLVKAFQKITGKVIPYEITGRRPGDIDVCYGDPSKALLGLGWKAQRNLEDMCRDSWRWQELNPNGYDTDS